MQEENMVTPENNQVTEELQATVADLKPVEPRKKCFRLPSLYEWILLAGLAVLYILHFTAKKPDFAAPLALQKASSKQTTVVFVNIDSLNARYEYVKMLRSDLESTGKRLQSEVLSEQAAFEKEAGEFQKQVAANAISEDKAKVIYEQLMKKQQELVDKKDRYTQQVADKELKMNITLLDTVTNFLKRYNKKYKFDYIMGLKTAGEILVANDTLDITRDVLDALNKDYRDKQK